MADFVIKRVLLRTVIQVRTVHLILFDLISADQVQPVNEALYSFD